VGNNGGILSTKERRSGAVTPTKSPQGAPQINPQRITGICIGKSIAPTCGICPVKKGKTKARAKNIADNISFNVVFLFFIKSLPFKTI
jgi:hypothetical protein